MLKEDKKDIQYGIHVNGMSPHCKQARNNVNINFI